MDPESLLWFGMMVCEVFYIYLHHMADERFETVVLTHGPVETWHGVLLFASLQQMMGKVI
jgi:hypothetical protein